MEKHPSVHQSDSSESMSILLTIPDLRTLSLDELTALLALRRRYQRRQPTYISEDN
jgi:hypothetical protein